MCIITTEFVLSPRCVSNIFVIDTFIFCTSSSSVSVDGSGTSKLSLPKCLKKWIWAIEKFLKWMIFRKHKNNCWQIVNTKKNCHRLFSPKIFSKLVFQESGFRKIKFRELRGNFSGIATIFSLIILLNKKFKKL